MNEFNRHPKLAEVQYLPNGDVMVRFKVGTDLDEKREALRSLGYACRDRRGLYMPRTRKPRKGRKSRKHRSRAG